MKSVREGRGVSLGTLSRDLPADKSHLSKIERGEVGASPQLANKIAIYFNNEVTRDQILFPDDYPMDGRKKPVKSSISEEI